MKKSEMLSKLQDLLENVNVYNPRVAREILQLVEDVGMSPPETLFKPNSKYGCLCTMRESCRGCGGRLNEWEDE